MWLLYVTFEDFVCIHHPTKSQDLISSSINIDSYLDPKSLHCGSRHLIRRSISDSKGREILSENQGEVNGSSSSNNLDEVNSVCSDVNTVHAQAELFVQADKHCDNYHLGNLIVSYRFAKKLHIARLYSHENNDFKTIRGPNGVKQNATMALSRPERKTRSTDKMRDYSAQNTKQKLRDFKSNLFATSDKLGYSQEFSAVSDNHLRDGRTQDCVSRPRQTAKQTLDNRRYKPDLSVTNKCANNGDAILRSNCSRSEERLKAGKSYPRGQRNTHQSQSRSCSHIEVQEKDSSLINRINNLCWVNDSTESLTGQTDGPVNLTPQRPTVLFNNNDRNVGDLKRSNDLVSPRSDTTITPDNSCAPKRHCVFPCKQDDPALLSPDSGLDRTRSLSDSFDQMMSSGSQFDDPSTNADDANVTPCVHSSDSSPVTISSGYESDSLPTCEAEIDKIFVKRNKRKSKSAATEPTTDYFSLSETYPPNLNASVADMGYKSQQPPKVIVTRVPEKVMPRTSSSSSSRYMDNGNTISVPDKSSVRNIRATEGTFQCQLPLKPRRQILQETSQPHFSPSQRHNYQLTKVARSMFQIIHDLQIEKAEKESQDNKKKCRKVKRAPAFKEDTTAAGQTNNVPETSASLVVEQRNVNIEDNQQIKEQKCNFDSSVSNKCSSKDELAAATKVVDKSVVEQTKPVSSASKLPQQPGKFVVKCVRRPLGSNPADFLRDLPHSSSAVDYEQDENIPMNSVTALNHHADAVSPRLQFLRQGVTDRVSNSKIDMLNHNVLDSEKNPFIINGCSPYATTKLPGCSTPRRDDRLDDHVYETIPGDEYLYAEFLRLRELGLLPKRLNRIPDVPGHFIPFDPPALPARNNELTPNDKTFCVRDHSKRPPMPPPSQVRCTRRPETQKSRAMMMRSFSWEGRNVFDPNMSTQSVPDKYLTNPGNRSDMISPKWTPGDDFHYVEGVRQPPPKRRENFYLLLQNKQKRAEISQSLEIETKLKTLGLVFDERFKGNNVDEHGYTTVDDDLLPMEQPRDRSQVFLKSTFV